MSDNITNKLKLSFLTLILLSSLTYAQTSYTVSGTVLNPNANPIEGVDVLMYNDQGDPIGQYFDVTDINGDYSIELVYPADYGISFRPADDTYAPEFTSFTVINANVTVNMTLQFGNILSGYVTNTLDEPLEGVDLNIYDHFTGIKLYTPSDNTNAEGFYDVVIPDGTYIVTYRTIDGERFVPVEFANVPIFADTSIDVVLEEGYFINGTVTGPGGIPVVNADLDAENSLTGIKLYTPNDNTDDNGEYQLLLPSGEYDINVSPLPQDRLLPAIEYNVLINTDITLDFSLETGYLFSGTVSESGGQGVYNVDLDVEDASTGIEVFTPYDNTDSSGLYQIILPIGIFNVAYKPPVEPPYLAPHMLEDFIISSDTVVDIALYPGLLLSGEVQNSFGSGVANVDIDAVNSADSSSVPLSGDHTDSLGQFITVIQTGTYHLEFEPPADRRLEAKLILNVPVNDDTSLTAVLDTAMMVSGTVTDTLGAPVPYIEVTASESGSGNEIFTPGNQTDNSGYYRILVHPDLYDLKYQSLIFPSDSMVLIDVNISADTVIDVVFENMEVDTVAPSVTVIAPNGGETWDAFSTQAIMWNATDDCCIDYIDIFYSVNGFSGPFSVISDNEQNDGIYFWQIPYAPTENAIVKIVAYDVGANSSFDYSDSPFTIQYDPSSCIYVPGDANNDGLVIGSDVTYLVNYFRGEGAAPPVACWDNHNSRFNFAAADANGDCQLIGSDITFLVNYFRQVQPAILYCPYTPPSGP